MLKWFSVVIALLVSTSFGQSTQPALPHVALNSTFANEKVGEKRVAGWYVVVGTPEVVTEKDTTFLRLAASETQKSSQIRRTLPIDKDWAKLTIAAKVRYKNVKHGEKSWQDARIIVDFLDDKNKRVGALPAAMNWKGSSKGGWIDETSDYVVPFGATQMKLEVALLQVESGTLDLASLTVTATESRSAVVATNILPDDWKPALVPHWRESTATREKICLNGVWQVRPIGLAEGDPKQVTAGVIQNPPFPAPMAAGIDWGYGKIPSTFPGTKESAHDWKFPPAWGELAWASIDAVWFRRTVEVPAEWKGRRVLLDFDTPQSMVAVFVGEKLIGRTAFPGGAVDVTDAIAPGTAAQVTLLVIAKPFQEQRVNAMNPNELYLETTELKQKGLCGDVFLRSEPVGARISNVQLRPSVRNKSLAMHVTTTDVKAARLKVTASIGDAVETEWTSEPLRITDGVSDVTMPWQAAKLWDIDQPNLYRLRIALVDDTGKLLDEIEEKLGFREMWLDGRDIMLNGSPIHWRASKIGNNFAGRSKSQMAGTFRRMRELGFNAGILDYDVYAGSAPSYQPMLQAADEAGIVLTFTIPSLLPWKGDAPDEAARKSWEKLTDACIRAVQNHPCVLAYATNHNRLGYVGSMNPDKLDGLHDPISPDPAFGDKRKIAADAEAYIRKVDPTREVYHHSSGNFGAWETSNTYLNWMPLQERADYLEHWGTKGVKPLFLTEFGMPFVASFGRYRGPGVYKPTADSEPLFIEYAAALTGGKAYEMNSVHEQYVDQYESAYAKTGKSSWAVLTNPWMRRSTEWNYVEIQTMHALKTFPAMRTWGISGLLPWDFKQVANWTDKTPAKVTLTEPAEQWTTPGLHPDTGIGFGYSNEESWFNTAAPETFKLTSLGEAYRKVQADVLGWIAGGPEKFTDESHLFSPGQKVTKQVIVINDLRRELKSEYDVKVTLRDREIASKTGQVTVAAGKQTRTPFEFTIPTGGAGMGKIALTLHLPDGKTSTDEFSFEVLTPVAAPKATGVALWDPKGLTTKSLKSIGVTVLTTDSPIPADINCLLIGREALSVEGSAPDIRPLLARGGRVVVFEQTESVLSRRLGFRTAVPSMRNAFVRTNHPLTAGLTDDRLRDWNGDATLIPGRLQGLPEFEQKYNAVDWLGFRNSRVWKVGNWGQLASVVIEKPQTGDFLPLIDGGFDLQYSPLLLAREGTGQILFCQLDLSGRSANDPVADRLLANIVTWATEAKPAATSTASVISDSATQSFLGTLGAKLIAAETAPADGVCVIGPDITRDKLTAMLPAIQKSHGTFVFLSTPAAALQAFGDQLKTSPVKLIADSLGESAATELTSGISPAELNLRSRTPITAVAPKAGWQSTAGALATMKLGDANLVFVQIDPRTFDYNKPSRNYVKLTHNRTRTLLSRVLANAGVPMTSPLIEHWSTPADKAAERWKASYYQDVPVATDDPLRYYRW